MKIAIGSDHAGFEMKTYLTEMLKQDGYDIVDCGTYSKEPADYPDFAEKTCNQVQTGSAQLAVLICATGIGISIAANKMHGIRAALCHSEFDARMSRQHNDANVLAIGGGVVGKLLALAIARTFLGEPFTGEDRHQRRVDKIMQLESSALERGGLDKPAC